MLEVSPLAFTCVLPVWIGRDLYSGTPPYSIKIKCTVWEPTPILDFYRV